MRVDPVDAKEVCFTIATFNPNKACGPSSVPSYVLHYMQDELANPLAKIVNISLSTGIHPDKLKIAKITPIYKKGSKLSTSNYRPISLLSNIVPDSPEKTRCSVVKRCSNTCGKYKCSFTKQIFPLC